MDKEKFISSLKEAMEVENRAIQMDDAFRNYPEWDSLAQLTLIAMLDEEYGITIEMKHFNDLITVNDLFEAVKISSSDV